MFNSFKLNRAIEIFLVADRNKQKQAEKEQEVNVMKKKKEQKNNNKYSKSRGQLAQSHLLSNPAIWGGTYVEEVFFRAEVRSSTYHKTSSKLNAQHRFLQK